MAAKKASKPSDRTDPRKNKSLAIRNVMKTLSGGTAAEIAAAVKKEYGHNVSPDRIYMVKTKGNMALTRKKTKKATTEGFPVGAAQWIAAIKIGHQLLRSTGSLDNAVALLKAIEGN